MLGPPVIICDLASLAVTETKTRRFAPAGRLSPHTRMLRPAGRYPRTSVCGFLTGEDPKVVSIADFWITAIRA
jgi:hypothetical protein